MVRTSIVLAVLTLGVLAYILFVDKDTLGTRELQQREHNVLPEMIRAKVSRIEIQRKGVSTVLERTLDVDDESGLWRVTAPYAARADRDAVDTLLGELEWMDSRRKLTDVSEGDRRRFGFDAPRYRVRFKVGKADVTAVVGNPSPKGDGIYVRGSDEGVVFVVGKDLIEVLDHEPEHYHTKELHEGLMVATATDVLMRDADGERKVTRRNDRLFDLVSGGRGLASEPDIVRLIDSLDALRASRFVAAGVTDLKKYGLDPADFDLVVQRSERSETGEKDAAGEVKRTHSQLRLRLGSACGDHAGERHITMDGSGEVFCALEADLEKLRPGLDQLRERRALALEDARIGSVTIESGGRTLAFTKKDSVWSYAVQQRGKADAAGTTREGSVPDWLNGLRAATVERFDAGKLRDATASLTFKQASDAADYRLQGSVAPDGVILQRSDEPFTVALVPSAIELLAPPLARFLPLTVATRDEGKLTRIEVTRASQTPGGRGVTERVQRAAGDAWEITAPEALDGDRVILGEIARLLSSLEAVHRVADEAAAEHGLDPPAMSVTAHFGEGDSLDLLLGAQTEGGRFARLRGDPGVFVVSARLCDQLGQPFVSRGSLAVPLEHIREVEVETDGRSSKVQGDGTSFSGEGVDPGRARELAEAVATLRASRVIGIGAPDPALGFAEPHARVRVRYVTGVTGSEGAAGAAAEQSYELLLGAATADQAGRHARRTDKAVTFVLPSAQVIALLGE